MIFEFQSVGLIWIEEGYPFLSVDKAIEVIELSVGLIVADVVTFYNKHDLDGYRNNLLVRQTSIFC